MALRQREVTGFVVDGDGMPVTDAKVKFKPTAPLGYTTTHVIVDREFTATTDENGAFSITLWCDEDSLVAINYNVYFPVVNAGLADAQHIANFSLAYGDGSPINIGLVLSAEAISPPSDQEQLATLINDSINSALISPSSPHVGEQTWSIRTHGEPKNDNVIFGLFWDANVDLAANQFIEVFAKFHEHGEYLVDDSDGGRHSGVLLGVETDGYINGNTSVLIGGILDVVSFGSGIPITLYDLGVLARTQTPFSTVVYWKGFPLGIKEFSGTATRNYDDVSAAGILCLGALDHAGKVANTVYLRIKEGGTIPITIGNGYAPSKFVGHNTQNRLGSENTTFNGIWSFTNPFNTHIIPDLSLGHEVIAGEGKVLHHGYLGDSIPNASFPLPPAEVTGEKPVYEKILFGQTPFVGTIPTPPSGALVCDTHTRKDSTHQWSRYISPGTGELGGDWAGNTQNWGIVSQHLSGKQVYSPIWKVSPVTDYEVTYTRANSAYLRSSGHYETYCPKMIDADNFVQLSFDPYGYLYLADATSVYGGSGFGSTITAGLTWTTLRVRFVGTAMEIFIDGVSKGTFTAPSRFNGATKAGLIDTSDNYRKLKSILIKAS